MKIRRRYQALISDGLGDLDVAGNTSNSGMPMTHNSRWVHAISKIQGQGNPSLACHFKVTRRSEGGKRATNEDSIEVIETDELDTLTTMTPERKRSLMLKATAKSMYPMVVNCFVFFEFEHSNVFSFYNTVLDQTVSALLIT